ncbi:hypothetical protein ABFS82_11G002300 [Erythranthe guttata]
MMKCVLIHRPPLATSNTLLSPSQLLGTLNSLFNFGILAFVFHTHTQTKFCFSSCIFWYYFSALFVFSLLYNFAIAILYYTLDFSVFHIFFFFFERIGWECNYQKQKGCW